MANQEFPLFALNRGATLLGDAMMPRVRQREGDSYAASNAVPEPARSAGLIDRLDAWFWRQNQRSRESWLAQSHDVFELERRMRDMERVGGRYY